MKLVNTQDAIGSVLAHDITQIIPGEFKGARFKKGHIVTEEDIPVLLSIGKEHLYIWEKEEGMLHEDEAAMILKEIAMGSNMYASEASEGKVEIFSDIDGILKIHREKLVALNSLGEMMIASIHGDFPVKKGDKIAGTRIIPLVIEKEKMEKAKAIAGDEAIFSILPFKKKKVGIITTGSEVFKGRIEDAFGPAIRKKLEAFDTQVVGQVILDDSKEDIIAAIKEYASSGVDLILCTGGMSVDPDDKTPGAIKESGARVVSYGAPVLPGAMFLLAYYPYEGSEIPILGLPGCVMYARKTIFDLVLPRVLADDVITESDLASFGEGGLCLNCEVCHFPQCGFGK